MPAMQGVHIIRDESELAGIAQELLTNSGPKVTATVFALEGDLGAGKTALTKAIARELGIVEHITSPTFVIMKTYEIPSHPIFHTLVHVDAYRIDDEDEMRVLGFEQMLRDPHALIAVEWPLRIPSYIPGDARHVTISIESGGTRSFVYDS